MIVPQLVVIALLLSWQAQAAAAVVTGLVGVQVWMLTRLVREPTADRALWVSAFGVPLFVLGMMVSAYSVRGLV